MRSLVTVRTIAWLLLAAPALAGATGPVPDLDQSSPEELRGFFKRLEGTRRLPVHGLVMAQVGDRLVLMSETGRLAVVGKFRLLDVWNQKEIKSLADAETLDRLDLKKIGLKDGDLAILKIGRGQREVPVFVDPLCKYCHDLIGQMEVLGEDYTFKLIVTPVLGDESGKTARKLMCDPDRARALRALVKGEFAALPEAPKDCDTGPLVRTLATAQILGIDGVPYLILPSTKVHKGLTTNLKELLENDAKS